MRSKTIWAICLAACATAGCQAGGQTGAVGRDAALRKPVDQIDGLQLNAAFAPLAEPGQPPKGLGVTLYAYRGKLPVAVANRVQVLMFEGTVSAEAARTAQPYHQWDFTAEQLKLTFGPGDFGLLCYHIPLVWDSHAPRTEVVTLVARYLPQSGPPVYSGICTVPLRAL